MTNYVFVHGGNVSATVWNKLVGHNEYPEDINLGGKIWQKIGHKLSCSNHLVITPTLVDEYKNNLSAHIQQICEIIIQNKLTKIVLVGHSYGGMVITGVADRLNILVDKLVYIDAALPQNKESLFDLLTLANIDFSAIIDGFPEAYTERITFNEKNIANLSKYYIFCTRSEFISLTNLAKRFIIETKTNWNLQEIDSNHFPMATKVDWLYNFLSTL